MKKTFEQGRQDGAILITVALSLLFLLGFMGISLDFGRLFIIKTELQTAMDSCALAAAQELDGASDSLDRATKTGSTAGNLNKVSFQSGPAEIADNDISFSETLTGTYSRTLPASTAKYAKCSHTKSGIAPWLLQFMGLFTGDNGYGNNRNVFAHAVATRASAQSSCAIPVQINPKGTGTNFGFAPGEWIPSLYDENSSGTSDTAAGHFGWANLNGSSSASDTVSQLLGKGVCDLQVNDVSTPGAKVGARTAWNTRFGLYKNGSGNPDINNAPPDLTGYSYYLNNWPTKANASSDFLAKRASNRSYGDTVDSVNQGDSLTGLNMKGSYRDSEMGTYAAGTNSLATHGQNRRLALAPVVSSGKIIAFACILLLHPIDGPNVTVYLEYIGNASALNSPCSTSGLAGGTGGSLVPTLVQ